MRMLCRHVVLDFWPCTKLNIKAANGINIPYKGCTEINVRFAVRKQDLQSIQVPMIVTEARMEHTILGYNVIEEMVNSSKDK